MAQEQPQRCGLYGKLGKDMGDARFLLQELITEMEAAGWGNASDLLCDECHHAIVRLLAACGMAIPTQEVMLKVRSQLDHHDVLGGLGGVFDKIIWLDWRHQDGLAEGRMYPIVATILKNFRKQGQRKGLVPCSDGTYAEPVCEQTSPLHESFP